MPSKESNGAGSFWYSFDHGMAHNFTVDTGTGLGHTYAGIAPDEVNGPEGEHVGPFQQLH